MISVKWLPEDGPLPQRFRNMVSPGLEDGAIIRVEQCVCGEERCIWLDDPRDAWKDHVGYCEAWSEGRRLVSELHRVTKQGFDIMLGYRLFASDDDEEKGSVVLVCDRCNVDWRQYFEDGATAAELFIAAVVHFDESHN